MTNTSGFNADGLKNFGEQLGNFFGNALKGLDEGLEKLCKTIDETIDAFDKGLEKGEGAKNAEAIEAANKANIDFSEVETLDSMTFFGICRKIMAEGADGIAAIWQPGADGKPDSVFLANVCGRELLPVEKNKYAIIKAKTVADDVKEVFGDEKLVILN